MIRPVKKLLAAAFLLGLCAFAQPRQMYAQRYGVPACATCITPRNPTPGVPASATSFTAANHPASMGGGSSRFRSTNVRGDFDRRDRGNHRRSNFGVPFGYGYPLYVPTYETQPEAAPEPAADVPSGNAMDREMWSRAAEREDQNIKRNDAAATGNANASDPRYGEHYLDGREAGRAGASKPDAAPAREEDNGPSVVLMMRDGSRVELGNYAIVGQTIFDLGAGRRKKIALADLDMPATQKANDALGLDFKLPAR